MKKKSLLALLVAAVMLLSGCSLVLRDSAVDELQTIIEVNGETVNKHEFLDAYNYYLYVEQYYASLYSQLGLSYTVDESNVLNETLSAFVNDIVLRQKLAELGLDAITEEDAAALDAEAQEEYQAELDSVREQYFADSELTGEALDAAVADYAADMGYTLESIRSSKETTELNRRLRAYVTDPISLTEEDLQAALEEKIAAEKSSYESSLAAYGVAANKGTFTYYTPAGYRSIRLVKVAKPAEDAGEALAEAEALRQRLSDGEAIDALGLDVAEYVVCESSTDVDAAVVAAVVALTEKGAFTEIVETDDAYVIAEYVDDVVERAATLDETRDMLQDETLETKQTNAYNDAVSAWVDAATINIYTDRLN